MIYLHQSFTERFVAAALMDQLWERGWRHFGEEFFRYSLAEQHDQICTVMPLRIKLAHFTLSRSQKRVLSKNREAQVIIKETTIDDAKVQLFERHRERFTENIPDSLYTFLSEQPASVPCQNREICVYANGELLATSFLDLGERATSAVYAMFEPTAAWRSLGIFTMLRAIEYSKALGCDYYYPGYAYREPSVYDYKKNFAALEYYDWDNGWQAFRQAANGEQAR